MKFNKAKYRSAVEGCFLGKNIGGTLGEPMEWARQRNNVTFYTQDLKGEPMPNDDLDIQLLWLIALEEQGIDLDAITLGEYWQTYLTPYWCEYGIAKVNMRQGLAPPACGTYGNEFKDSCGSFIRSEIWACIAPGMPGLAAKYAYMDSAIDHGDGEGTWAEIFVAALESAAFVEKDIHVLLDIGLSYIDPNCAVAGAVALVRECHRQGMDYLEVRDKILEKYRGAARSLRGPDFAYMLSDYDREKGFEDGPLGFDVANNIGILVTGLLYGGDSFDDCMCLTVNCGEDTDCTAATIGSIYGILHGAQAIPDRWIEPIGRQIKTCCLNAGDLGHFGALIPGDIDELTERVCRLAEKVSLSHQAFVFTLEDDQLPADKSFLYEADFQKYAAWMRGPIYRDAFFEVQVDYCGNHEIKNGEPVTVKLHIDNTYRMMEPLNIRFLGDEAIQVLPSRHMARIAKNLKFLDQRVTTVAVTVQLEEVNVPVVRGVFEITSPGRCTSIYAPLVLMNGNGC